MQEIRVLGHLPACTKDAPLALRLHRAKASEDLSASQLAELEANPAFSKRVTGACATEILMTEMRAFGTCPKRQQVDMKENALAECLFSGWVLKVFSIAAQCFSACSLPTFVITVELTVELIMIACEATRRCKCVVKHASEAFRTDPQPDA